MEEERAPSYDHRLCSQRGGQLELNLSALPRIRESDIATYECRVLVRFQHDMQHFPGILTHLTN